MKCLVLLILSVLSLTAFCFGEPSQSKTQSQVQSQPLPNTLQQQYKNLKSDLEIINGFRMVKMFTMDRLWSVVEDSLATQKSKLEESLALIDSQNKNLIKLNNSLGVSLKEKADLITRVENIMVFGIPFSKGGFTTTVSMIFLGLIIAMGILFFVTRVSNRTTNELRRLNESLYQEFDTYKRHAVEKEIKILRELQDCRNRLAELKMA